MTHFVARWFTQHTEVELERIARKVARASAELTQTRLNSTWSQCSNSEAGGYLRARARRVVTRETQQLLGPLSDYTPTEVDGIIRRAIQMTAEQLLRQRHVAPAVAVERQAA